MPLGAARTEALALELEVNARAHPSLKPLASAENLRFNLVNCRNRLSCGLAGLLLPESAFLNDWEMQFDNLSAAGAKLAKSAVVLLGEKTGFQLSSDQFALPSEPQTFPAGETSSLSVTLNRTAMAPDHYTGSLYLMLEDVKNRLTIPVDMHVRIGPLFPLVAILAGIILGRLVKYMQEHGGPQAEKLTEVNRVELLLRHAPDADRKILMPQLTAVRRKVYQYALDTVTTELNTIKARLETLGRLRDMEIDLQDKKGEPDAQTALQKITEARQRMADGQDVSDLVTTLQRGNAYRSQKYSLYGFPWRTV